jgi:poly-beta-1,6-N-acetyl-D-glucosamine synthase
MQLISIFWISFTIVFYTYIGYGIVIYLISRMKAPLKVVKSEQNLPQVTLLIAAYNEAKFIEEKIKNTLALNYPKDLLEIIVVTDGSTDKTPEFVSRYPEVRLLHEPIRRGKIHAVNRAMQLVKSPITIFCDANTYLNQNCIRKLIRHYDDPTIGGVAGEKRILQKQQDSASASGEGLYWQYESFLKRKDAEVYTVVGAAGELFSIRTTLFEAPPEKMIIEDFYLSMRMVEKGYRFAYEPEAYAMETSSASVEEEWKRKVRISAGAFQAMGYLRPLLNPFRHGIVTFQYFSHRVLRWTLAPLALIFLWLSNLVLAWQEYSFFQLTFALQCCFYIMAFAGYVYRNRNIKVRGFFVPYYFTMMNAAVFAGFVKHMKGTQSVLWDRSERAEYNVK